MSKQKEKVSVIFRKFKGSIIALFPYENFTDELCMSYEHMGQHSGASYTYVIYSSRPAVEAEYLPLKKELESIGYDLTVIKRRQRK